MEEIKKDLTRIYFLFGLFDTLLDKKFKEYDKDLDLKVLRNQITNEMLECAKKLNIF